MALNNQIHIYSLGTDAFYTDEENALQTQIHDIVRHEKQLKEEEELIFAILEGRISEEKARAKYRTIYRIDKEIDVQLGGHDRIDEIKAEIRKCHNAKKLLKANLSTLFSSNAEERGLRADHLRDYNVISVFESVLTRTLGMETGNLYTDLFVVRCFYYDVMHDLITDGFTYDGDHYVCFTASAGQIRTKKAFFIKESILKEYQSTLMCGLTVDEINAHGGININKYLAYLALCSTATDPWDNFNINKTIVVDDFETMVRGEVDYINPETFEIERRVQDIPITHTDGCGMVLPDVCDGNMQIRLPWVKGLLAVFPFDKFIREANEKEPEKNHGIVKDIYGIEHDILAEGIEIILTKSQFKMWMYYSSWDDYKRRFTENECCAGKCGEERRYIPNTKTSYQMLQTLTDMSEEELNNIASTAIDRITHIATDRETMLKVFGASEEGWDKNGFQQCLLIYPELLSDGYTRERLKAIKKKLVLQGRAGKLPLNGKYMFLVPDLYAFCEWLFLGEKDPQGLLQNGEVSAYMFRNTGKLDCLRSPHLYREHAVRQNVVNTETRRWFTKKAIYTSCHDLISKVLQFDVDGDTSLVIADPLFIKVAERNMQGIVPLYYEMGKAAPTAIKAENIYSAMRSAWKFGNIGKYSNIISRMWNSDNPDIDLIKIETALNNFSIDAAKTNLMPTPPDEIFYCLFG